jgi:hypothetical protein
MDNPLPIRRLSRDHADMVAPYDNNADAGTTSTGADMGPFTRQCEPAIRLSEISGHVNSAPGARVPTVVGMAVTTMDPMGIVARVVTRIMADVTI